VVLEKDGEVEVGLTKFYKESNKRELSYITCTIKRIKCNWIDHILHKNCLVKHVIGGKIEEKEGEKEGQASY
jgi:hypothetical protein